MTSTTRRCFHSVIVVTDRRVLDQQLQSTIYQFEHKAGVVEKIDEDTQQLAPSPVPGHAHRHHDDPENSPSSRRRSRPWRKWALV